MMQTAKLLIMAPINEIFFMQSLFALIECNNILFVFSDGAQRSSVNQTDHNFY